MLFAAGDGRMWRGREEAVQFITGYLIELSLSMDNIFVIALIFTSFRVPPRISASRAVSGEFSARWSCAA